MSLPAPHVCVVLVSPKEPGNVGSSARAMLNMGVSDLRIVAPRCDLSAPEASYMAVHAKELVSSAQVFDTLEAALHDRDYAVGTSAREHADLAPPVFPSELRPAVLAARKVAVVFGREESGLTTEELARCQARVRIPTAEYASLNLSQAVLIVLYEFLQAPRSSDNPLPSSPAGSETLAPRDQMERFYEQLRGLMLETGYTDTPRIDHMMRLYRKVFDRAGLSLEEARMLRGFWSQLSWVARGNKPKLK